RRLSRARTGTGAATSARNGGRRDQAVRPRAQPRRSGVTGQASSAPPRATRLPFRRSVQTAGTLAFRRPPSRFSPKQRVVRQYLGRSDWFEVSSCAPFLSSQTRSVLQAPRPAFFRSFGATPNS